jgi:hypothetical protein
LTINVPRNGRAADGAADEASGDDLFAAEAVADEVGADDRVGSDLVGDVAIAAEEGADGLVLSEFVAGEVSAVAIGRGAVAAVTEVARAAGTGRTPAA